MLNLGITVILLYMIIFYINKIKKLKKDKVLYE